MKWFQKKVLASPGSEALPPGFLDLLKRCGTYWEPKPGAWFVVSGSPRGFLAKDTICGVWEFNWHPSVGRWSRHVIHAEPDVPMVGDLRGFLPIQQTFDSWDDVLAYMNALREGATKKEELPC